jgi:cytochrome P450
LHVALGKLAVLTPNRTFQWHVRRVHDFIDGYVHKALAGHNETTRDHNESHDEPAQKKKQPYVFLQALVQDTQDPKWIRDELLNILIAGRDTTTASLTSNVFLMLSKHPKIWSRLRGEINFLQRQPPTFDQLQQCKLLRFTINESQLYLLLPKL